VGGNRIVNSIFEGRIAFDTSRPNSDSDSSTRYEFILQKYVEKRWYNPAAIRTLVTLNGGMNKKRTSQHGPEEAVPQVALIRACSSDTLPKSRSRHGPGGAGGELSSSSHHKPRRHRSLAVDVQGADDTCFRYGEETRAGKSLDRTSSVVSTSSAGTSQRRMMSRRSSMPSAANTMDDEQICTVSGGSSGGNQPPPPIAPSRPRIGRSSPKIQITKKPSSFVGSSKTSSVNSRSPTASRKKPKSTTGIYNNDECDDDDADVDGNQDDSGCGKVFKAVSSTDENGNRGSEDRFSFEDSFASFGCDADDKAAWWESNTFFPSPEDDSDGSFIDGFSKPVKCSDDGLSKTLEFRPTNNNGDANVQALSKMPVRTKSLEGALNRRSRRLNGDSLNASLHRNATWHDPKPAPLRRQGESLGCTSGQNSPLRQRESTHSTNVVSSSSNRRMTTSRPAVTTSNALGRRSGTRSMIPDDSEVGTNQGSTRISGPSGRPTRNDPDDDEADIDNDHPGGDNGTTRRTRSRSTTCTRSRSRNSSRSLVARRVAADTKAHRNNIGGEGSDHANCMRRSRRRETTTTPRPSSSLSLPVSFTCSSSCPFDDPTEGQESRPGDSGSTANSARRLSSKNELGSTSSHERRRRRTAHAAVSPKRTSSRENKIRANSPKRQLSYDPSSSKDGASAINSRPHRSRSSTVTAVTTQPLPSSLRTLPTSKSTREDRSDRTVTTTCSSFSILSQDPPEFAKKITVGSLYGQVSVVD
jgi:hypothetical protein